MTTAEEETLAVLKQIIQEDKSALIEEWVTYFEPEERPAQARYYADFLSFFEECLESGLAVDSEEARALSHFMQKLAEILGDKRFFNFRSSVYTCYLKFPLMKQLEARGAFCFAIARRMTSFFESLTSRLVLHYVESRERAEAAAAKELQAREAPISEIWDGVLLVAIVGTLDSQRVIEIMDKVLSAVESTRAREVILDVGSIHDINTEVALQLQRLNHAIAFMGARAHLAGINKNIAKVMAQLDITVGEMATFRTVRQALESLVAASVSSQPRTQG